MKRRRIPTQEQKDRAALLGRQSRAATRKAFNNVRQQTRTVTQDLRHTVSLPQLEASVPHEMAPACAEPTIRGLGGFHPPRRRWLTSAESAAYLGLASADVLAVWRAQGRAPPHVGTGKMIRYDINVLDEWVASRPTQRTYGGCVGGKPQ